MQLFVVGQWKTWIALERNGTGNSLWVSLARTIKYFFLCCVHACCLLKWISKDTVLGQKAHTWKDMLPEITYYFQFHSIPECSEFSSVPLVAILTMDERAELLFMSTHVRRKCHNERASEQVRNKLVSSKQHQYWLYENVGISVLFPPTPSDCIQCCVQ